MLRQVNRPLRSGLITLFDNPQFFIYKYCFCLLLFCLRKVSLSNYELNLETYRCASEIFPKLFASNSLHLTSISPHKLQMGFLYQNF